MKEPPHDETTTERSQTSICERQRLKDLISYVRDFCAQHHEYITDVYILKNELQIQKNLRASALTDFGKQKIQACTFPAEDSYSCNTLEQKRVFVYA